MSPTAFALLISSTVLVGLFGIALTAYVWTQARAQSRLAQRLQESGVGLDDDTATAGWMLDVAERGRVLERWMDSEGEAARLLLQAGWRAPNTRTLWYALQVSLPIVAPPLTMTLTATLAPATQGAVIFLYGVMAFILAMLAPRWLLRSVAEARRQRIQREVPLFIHLLVLLFEAGLSTRQAFASLVREGRGVLPELGSEFERVLRQLDAGGDTAEILRGVAETLQVADLTSTLSVLRQMDRYGGEVREPLLDALAVIEERNSLDLREHVNRMSGRMTVVMVLFFFPALLVFVAGPAFVSILKALGEATAR